MAVLYRFHLVATLTMLNLFIAVIVNAMQSVHERERTTATFAAEITPEPNEAEMLAEFRVLREEMRQLREALASKAAHC